MKSAILAALLLAGGPVLAQDNPLQPSATWEDLRESVLGLAGEVAQDAAVLDLEAPVRAHEAAIVPVRLVQPAGAPPVRAATLVIDENPAPVAAEYGFGPALMPLDFEMRLRVDSYSDVRVIADTGNGSRVMAGRFVKASGGCSAPAGRDMAEAEATMGQMRWRSAPQDGSQDGRQDGRHVGTLMIRHPNFSGLQRDQVTLLNIPAHFIDRLEVRQGDEMLFSLEAGISISEDPVFRFAYDPNGQPIHVRAEDTEGNRWDQTFAPVSG